MKRIAVLFLLGYSFCVYAQTGVEQAGIKSAMLEAERIGCLAYEQNRAEGIQDFLTDDYTLTDSRGVVTTKKDDLDDILKHRIHYSKFVNKNMQVRLYPGVAIVVGQTIVRGTTQGKAFDVEVQFTDTLVWLHSKWKLAAGHVSRLQSSTSMLTTSNNQQEIF